MSAGIPCANPDAESRQGRPAGRVPPIPADAIISTSPSDGARNIQRLMKRPVEAYFPESRGEQQRRSEESEADAAVEAAEFESQRDTPYSEKDE